VERLSDLLLLDLELFVIWDREPLAPTVELPLGWNRLFQWRLFHGSIYLSLEVVFFGLGDTEIYDRIWDRSTGDDDLASI
jgi:hypothetical protein